MISSEVSELSGFHCEQSLHTRSLVWKRISIGLEYESMVEVDRENYLSMLFLSDQQSTWKDLYLFVETNVQMQMEGGNERS